MRIRTLLRVFNIIITGLALAACSSPKVQAPITDATPIPSHKIRTHIVAPGETLYSIAWRYGLDYQDLSRANGLGANHRIYPGQALTLDLSRVSKAPTATSPPRVAARQPQPKKASPPQDRSKNRTSSPASSSNSTLSSDVIRWQWPLKGQVLSGFKGNGGLNKGIDLRGKLGEPVLAAAPGEVVYAGSGLRGYGKLLIVKHSEKYLSAYAHNRTLKVGEGERVRAGQQIAELGATGTDSPKLHFEIRYDGKPVDPMDYLPK